MPCIPPRNWEIANLLLLWINYKCTQKGTLFTDGRLRWRSMEGKEKTKSFHLLIMVFSFSIHTPSLRRHYYLESTCSEWDRNIWIHHDMNWKKTWNRGKGSLFLLHFYQPEEHHGLIKAVPDQTGLGEPVFMPIVNLYYKTDLSSGKQLLHCFKWRLLRSAAGSEENTHTHTNAHDSQQRKGQSKGQFPLHYI